MSDLLKESIADAKAVRETALANAKTFLEENFAASMKEMFADKLKEEMAEDSTTEEDPIEETLGSSNIGKDDGLTAKTAKPVKPSPVANKNTTAAGKQQFDAKLEEDADAEFEFELEENPEEDNEGYNYMSESKKMKKKMETKEGMKPKVGKGAAKPGSAKKFSYKTSKGGFKEDMKHASPTKGTGKPKFEFKEGEMMDMPSRAPKLEKEEAKEAARTYGFGSKSGRGLRKGVTPNRNYEYGKNVAESVEVMEELQMLRTKNEEYRKALNLFRDKLNEVAIFNSNLAYATRLFTEHSTSKHEKINILRRFDTAETLKESKALYKTIKDELSQGTKATPITESIERVIDREPQSGSAINLIESKTYENPQFLRMKDIMSKIAK